MQRISSTNFTIPNAISILRLGLIPVFVVLVVRHQDLAALIVVAVSSVSDWADGFIARKFNQVSELGKTLDPIADRCFIGVAFIVLVFRGEIPLYMLLLVLSRDVVMLVLVSLIARIGEKPMAVTLVGKGATLCLLVALPLFIFAALTSDFDAVSHVARILAWVFAIVGVSFYWLSAVQYLVRGVAILRQAHITKGVE